MVTASSDCPAVRPTNTIDFRLCRDDVVVGDDEDVNRTDFISSALLLCATLIFDGRRDE